MYTLSPLQTDRAATAAARALSFVETEGNALATASVRHLWFDGADTDVATALASFQNADGGFGNRLEPDLHAPASNPFAARVAMKTMWTIPLETTADLRHRLRDWLDANHHEDGDWHFSDDTRAGFMQPWFAGWAFPWLNPACCLVGLGQGLELTTLVMEERVSTLFAERASVAEARDGEFYDVLPYIEYSCGVQLEEEYLDGLAANITQRGSESKGYADAGHFFTHALGGSLDLIDRIPAQVMSAQVDRLFDEQQDDGGWPTPYDSVWRTWDTLSAMTVLDRMRTRD